ncbi:hypothetical protein [Bacillus thuringiensis]|uniref:hypothetical protein n=1 Tax=Bacillus thuringiensis TaxID=1428 RepID=UPI0021D64FC9|nr:hypothetical protein [Bacillus thuringiensis]MCU7679190.1 hypothetical protein [Bacillus thuringiensis]
MDINEIIERAITDEEFANKLRSTAQQAANKGIDSPEWDELMAYFNISPETLARMKAEESSDMMPRTTTTSTTTTTTTMSTVVCTTTTITTTTTGF